MSDKTAPRNRYHRAKRLRAHVDYNEMSVSYGRVKLAVPTGFKEMLETVTREILREQPRDIPRFLATYFNYMRENQRRGIKTGNLVTERIVEVNKTVDSSTQDEPEVVEPIITQSNTCQTEEPAKEEESKSPEEEAAESVRKIETVNPDSSKSAPVITKSEEDNTIIASQSVGSILEKTLSTMDDVTPGPSMTALPVVSTSQISVASISQLPQGTRLITAEVIKQKSLTDVISKESLTEIAEETAEEVTTEANTNPMSLDRELENVEVDVDYQIKEPLENQAKQTESKTEAVDDNTPICEDYSEITEGVKVEETVKSVSDLKIEDTSVPETVELNDEPSLTQLEESLNQEVNNQVVDEEVNNEPSQTQLEESMNRDNDQVVKEQVESSEKTISENDQIEETSENKGDNVVGKTETQDVNEHEASNGLSISSSNS